MIRILLVDDQDLVRAGLKMICESEPGLVVVGEANHGEAAIVTARAARPDVILMDVQMPVMDGLEATRRLLADAEADADDDGPKVIMLTTFERDDYLFESLRAGASGFLLKNAPPEDLIAAVQTVAAGSSLLDPSVTRRVIRAAIDGAPATSRPEEIAELTERELDVLRAVGRGLSNAEVAAELFIGEATVKTHLSNVLSKLGLRDRIQAVVFAHEHRLV